MTIDYTTNALVASVRRRAFLPAGTGLQVSQILQYLTDELTSSVPSFLKALREEYLVVSLDLTVSGSDPIPAPIRAVGAAFRTIKWVRGDGRATPINRIEPERVSEYALTAAGEPRGYYFEGNNIVLVPHVPDGGKIRLSFQLRPGQLVLPDACCQVVTSNPTTGIVVVSSRPSTFGNSTLCDFVSGEPNFTASALDFNPLMDQMTWASPTSTTLQLTTHSDAELLLPGDFICLAGETPVPPLPTEVHNLLAQFAAAKIAQATGSSRAQLIQQGLTDLKADITTLLSPRSDGSARPIISRSGLGRRRF